MRKLFFWWFKRQNLSTQSDTIGWLKEFYHDKYNSTYQEVYIYNGKANISHIIEKATGYHCYHIPADNPGCIGTNVIQVPKSLFTSKLAAELQAMWDNY